MKILVLAWEFPPRIVGGISRHVAELYPELVQLNHEVHLLTVEFGQTPHYEIVDGIHVHRVPVAESHNFFHWVVNMNESMGRYGGKLLADGSFDLIHAHDWLVGDAAIALKYLFKLPLIATIHATEAGRCDGIHTDTNRYIHHREVKLAHEAWREIQAVLKTPVDKIDVIYNGIRRDRIVQLAEGDRLPFRRKFAKDEEKIVYYVGRMTHEKGVNHLLSAAPQVLQVLGKTVKFVIIGGGNTEHLKQQAWDLGIWHSCNFTGFMSDTDLAKFQAIANCAVFPSLYEPFGIVALESFAADVPVIVSDAGGLPEVVQHRKTGIVTKTADPGSIATGILEVLKDESYAHQLTQQAIVDLNVRFDWSKLAQQTEAVYGQVLAERSLVKW
jgi:glycosyltransferase involved in cell wall biosynthesis